MFRDLSLKLKLPIYLSTVLATVIVFLSAGAYHEVRQAQLGAAEERLRRMSQQLADLTSLGFEARADEMATLASEPSVVEVLRGTAGPDDSIAALALLAEATGPAQVLAVEVRDARGRRVLVHGDTSRVPGAAPQNAPSDGAVGPLQLARDGPAYATSAGVRIDGADVGTVASWRATAIDSAGRSVLSDLIGADAVIVLGSPGGAWTDLATTVGGPPLELTLDAAPKSGAMISYAREDVGLVYATVQGLDDAPWYLIVELPAVEVLAGARAFLLRLLILAPVALLIVAASAWILGRTITGSLRETAEAAEAIAAGESGHRVVVRGADEVGRLASSFNSMARQVEESQRALTELNESLSRSNAELENFAYVASHDLREPLRMVRSFTQLLADRYGGQLDENADKYIHFAVDGAARMEGLIQALLEYSRVDGHAIVPVRTDSSEVLAQSLTILKPSIDAAGATVTYDPLPTVSVDPDQLLRVFQNLIGNAIKFCKDAPPQVHVSARVEGDRHIFSVRDEGIGIDPEYFDRIFEIFKRLHGQRDFGGTGIGLSICQKIVERHGGRIWLESAPGEGSTFFFSLPRRAAMVA